MRTVITHFFNEAYLLPWWLEHHVKMFNHGILIDHGSTDESADICRQLAPHWRLVKSRLTEFDAWLTDFEVMNYEIELTGWKIALNTTEFLIANPGLDELERSLAADGRMGIAASGMTMIDKEPERSPVRGQSLVMQKPWAVDDNRFGKLRWLRQALGHPKTPQRNRFYHSLPTGMYPPGRHRSFHRDWQTRTPNLMVLHYGYAPWNEEFIGRKMQIADKIPAQDRKHGMGFQHLRNREQLQRAFDRFDRLAYADLRQHAVAGPALDGGVTGGMETILKVRNA